jgi:hypothetical protein
MTGGVNFSTLIYAPVFDQFAISITINPIVSQPAGAAFAARGIFDSRQQIVALDDGSVIETQDTICDILIAEFGVLPVQNDIVTIPTDSSGGVRGDYQITNTWDNGGGEMTLQLRKMV